MIRINLLPKERARRGPVVSRMFLVLGVLAVAVLLGGYYLILLSENARLQDSITETNKQIDVLRPQVAEIEVLKRRLETARRKAALLKTLESSRVPWATVLEEFRTIVPKDVWLTNMSAADDGALTFDGFGLSYEAVARLMVNLDSSKVFRDVDLNVAQKQPISATEVVNFQVVGRLRQERKEAGSQ